MTYKRTQILRLINAAEAFRIRMGIAPTHRYLLTVIGGRSGRPRTTPVAMVAHGEGRWLVAPYGEVAWVRNARAAGIVALSRGEHRERCRLTQASATEAGVVLKEYLALEPITRPYFRATAEDPTAAFAAEADLHPVFRLLPG
jgi:deazaflavin-dependent oxidoreductase (nitroreductase family)